MATLFRFLHEDAFTEPISIDAPLNSSHQSEPQLHFISDQDHPPVCPPKPFISAPVLVSSYAERVAMCTTHSIAGFVLGVH